MKKGIFLLVSFIVSVVISAQEINVGGVQMVLVEGGTFIMGCTPEQGSNCEAPGYPDRQTPHTVTLDTYYIGKYEITQEQWYEIMGTRPSYKENCNNCPVEQVSYGDVQEFIQKLNAKTGKKFRLPTEAEWEFAARGGVKSKGFKYSGGNDTDEVAWVKTGHWGIRSPQEVGKKKANELGIHDMSGNVMELCSDWFSENYYVKSPEKNPKGPETGDGKVMRGGNWAFYSNNSRVAQRYFKEINNKGDSGTGFRLAIDAE